MPKIIRLSFLLLAMLFCGGCAGGKSVNELVSENHFMATRLKASYDDVYKMTYSETREVFRKCCGSHVTVEGQLYQDKKEGEVLCDLTMSPRKESIAYFTIKEAAPDLTSITLYHGGKPGKELLDIWNKINTTFPQSDEVK